MGPNVTTTTSAFHPAPRGTTYVFKVSVTNVATELTALLIASGAAGVPVVPDKGSAGSAVTNRFPKHVIFSSSNGNADSIYMTMDGNTDPNSSTSFGWEMTPGGFVVMEMAFDLLLNFGRIETTNTTAFRFMADNATDMMVTFSD